MRNAFTSELLVLAKEKQNLVVLSADIGNRLFDKIKECAPDRFYNCGVAEANLMSMAGGMAVSGMVPVAYTITPFITIRCLEQIKIDICYHNVPAVLVGTGSGLSYAELGPTHHSCDDIALLRVLPNMKIVCPGDPLEVKLALRAAVNDGGPVYIRLGKKGEPAVHKGTPDFKIGEAIKVLDGTDVCLLSTGSILPTALAAGEKLSNAGISAQVISFHTVKPLDEQLLKEVFSKFKLVVTIEEHSVIGGLGSAVAEWFIDNDIRSSKLARIGLPDIFLEEAGKQEYYRKKLGLSAEGISKKVTDIFRKGRN